MDVVDDDDEEEDEDDEDEDDDIIWIRIHHWVMCDLVQVVFSTLSFLIWKMMIILIAMWGLNKFKD